MRKIALIALVAGMTVTLAACGNKAPAEDLDTNDTAVVETETVVEIEAPTETEENTDATASGDVNVEVSLDGAVDAADEGVADEDA
jgi:predicted small lipoprotein YifL